MLSLALFRGARSGFLLRFVLAALSSTSRSIDAFLTLMPTEARSADQRTHSLASAAAQVLRPLGGDCRGDAAEEDAAGAMRRSQAVDAAKAQIAEENELNEVEAEKADVVISNKAPTKG